MGLFIAMETFKSLPLASGFLSDFAPLLLFERLTTSPPVKSILAVGSYVKLDNFTQVFDRSVPRCYRKGKI